MSVPEHLREKIKDAYGRVIRSRLGLFECDNCGRKHIGIYETYYPWEGGREDDFFWTDWQGNERRCKYGHRRFPCDGPRCYECDARARVAAPGGPAAARTTPEAETGD